MYQRYSARNEGQTLQHNIHMTHKLKMNFNQINRTAQRLLLNNLLVLGRLRMLNGENKIKARVLY